MKRGKDKKGLPFFGIPKLAPYLKPYKMLFFWMVVTGTVGSGMDAIIPLFQQHAIDHFIADKTMQALFMLSVITSMTSPTWFMLSISVLFDASTSLTALSTVLIFSPKVVASFVIFVTLVFTFETFSIFV